MLNVTKNPNMLRSLIGENLTKEFTAFCKSKIVSIEDVICGNYTESDYDTDVSRKYLTALSLSKVDENNVKIVREFVAKMGLEFLTLFDNFWVNGDEKKKNILNNIKSFSLSWRK